MAKTTTCPIAQSIQNSFVQLANADGACGTTLATNPSNTKLLATAGAEGSVVKSLTITSDDTASKIVNFYLSTDGGTTKYNIGSVTVAAGSGNNGSTTNVDVLDLTYFRGWPVDQSGRNVLELAAAARIYVGVQAAVTAAKFINVHCSLEDF